MTNPIGKGTLLELGNPHIEGWKLHLIFLLSEMPSGMISGNNNGFVQALVMSAKHGPGIILVYQYVFAIPAVYTSSTRFCFRVSGYADMRSIAIGLRKDEFLLMIRVGIGIGRSQNLFALSPQH